MNARCFIRRRSEYFSNENVEVMWSSFFTKFQCVRCFNIIEPRIRFIESFKIKFEIFYLRGAKNLLKLTFLLKEMTDLKCHENNLSSVNSLGKYFYIKLYYLNVKTFNNSYFYSFTYRIGASIIMNYFTVLRFKQRSAVLNKGLIEQCLKQYLMCQGRLCVIEGENRYRHCIAKERAIRRKTWRTRILQDIKHTRRKVEEIIEKENIWTIPNLLCMGRIVTSPFLSYLILSQDYQVRLNILIKLYIKTNILHVAFINTFYISCIIFKITFCHGTDSAMAACICRSQ